MDVDALKAAIQRRKRRVQRRPKHAAVLVPIILDGDEPHLLLTRRTDTLSTHKGQVAFPGGRTEEDDVDRTATALREAEEEVGLPRGHVDILGLLDDFPTVTGDTIVTPVIGVVRRLPPLRAEPGEVARIFQIPFSALQEKERWYIRQWDFEGKPHPVYYFDWDGETLWGLSAFITLQVLDLLPERGPFRLPPPYGRR